MSIEELIATYDRVWNEPDDAERGRLLELCWADDGELVDPGAGLFRGRDSVLQRLGGFRARFPGARVDITSGLDENHGFSCAIDGRSSAQTAPSYSRESTSRRSPTTVVCDVS